VPCRFVLSKETREEDLSGNALACHGRSDQELGKHGEPIVGHGWPRDSAGYREG
jgi:hypothetical protein